MTKKKTAALLVGHGSRVENANDAMSKVVDLIRERNEYPIVEKGFLELSPPFIPDGIQKCIEQGAEEILIVPYFLHKGRHIRKDIPTVIKQEAEKYPDVIFRFGNTINFHPAVAEVIADRIKETAEVDDIRKKVIPENLKVIKGCGGNGHNHDHGHDHSHGNGCHHHGEKEEKTEFEFSTHKKQGVYDAIYQRRDIRHFQDKDVPEETLMRILDAAHHAPSVGYSQPWNFIIVRDIEKRQKIKKTFDRERETAGSYFEGEQKEIYDRLKLEGILDAPINICITCDRERFGPYILGKHSITETDLFSSVCAVQNLWLAARAEGVGVGWVSILRNEELHRVLGIPSNIIPVAYLCVGYPTEFSETPLLEKERWNKRVDLEELIFYDGWEGKKSSDNEDKSLN